LDADTILTSDDAFDQINGVIATDYIGGSLKTRSHGKKKHKFTYSDNISDLSINRQLMYISAKAKLEYMNTQQWKELKLSRLKIAQNKCECCGSIHSLQLHHITYIRLTQEHINDVAILCKSCHTKLHNLLGYDRATIYPISTIKD
jgi:hypothetical protein